MKINSTKFGSIIIDGQVYSHDIYILPNGKIEKRNKEYSPRIEGHRSLGLKEMEYLLFQKPDIIFIGMGQSGVLPLQEEAQQLLNISHCEVIKDLTPNLLIQFNQVFGKDKKICAIFHITC